MVVVVVEVEGVVVEAAAQCGAVREGQKLSLLNLGAQRTVPTAALAHSSPHRRRVPERLALTRALVFAHLLCSAGCCCVRETEAAAITKRCSEAHCDTALTEAHVAQSELSL